jgi:3-dehydroquinate dehydratase-2
MYGKITLAEIVEAVTARARDHDMEVVAFQSNHEGALIDWLQTEAPRAEGIVVNPGGLAHYSVALRDALEDTRRRVIEVHISNPLAREPFRRTLVTATAAESCIVGKGLSGYLEALDLLTKPREG